ncbi:MAG: FKBP-type peptidyl-prolyl cis-trans isomerase [Dysgonamonadaceae bacterium]|jgi:FKBP-type peptidyl-prolyl cis-trans isomerase|nr:FKBP-type peptidyl-prolyl cis-trans isomerase [Dysgonamonadaceae bacterium]
MKNKNSIFLFCTLAMLAFSACNETDDSSSQWQKDNQAAYDAIKNNSEWTFLDTGDGPSGVYYKDITDPETEIGHEYPLQTASVITNYTGKYYNDQIFDSGTKTTFIVNGLVTGFSAALQNMRTGQKWEICIPYYIGYGTTATTAIPAYTTLFFEIELLQINQYPK